MKICNRCIKGRLQRKSLQFPIAKATEFIEKILSDLRGPPPITQWGKQYYIFFYDDAARTYNVKTMRHKSQAFEKFLEFIFWAKNQSEKKLKRYQTNGGREFDNEALKN